MQRGGNGFLFVLSSIFVPTSGMVTVPSASERPTLATFEDIRVAVGDDDVAAQIAETNDQLDALIHDILDISLQAHNDSGDKPNSATLT